MNNITEILDIKDSGIKILAVKDIFINSFYYPPAEAEKGQ